MSVNNCWKNDLCPAQSRRPNRLAKTIVSRLLPKLAPPPVRVVLGGRPVTGLLAATDPFFFSVSFVSFVTPVPILCMRDFLPYLAYGTRPFVVQDYFDVHVVSLVAFVL